MRITKTALILIAAFALSLTAAAQSNTSAQAHQCPVGHTWVNTSWGGACVTNETAPPVATEAQDHQTMLGTPAFVDCRHVPSVFLFESRGGKVLSEIPCAEKFTVLQSIDDWDKVQTGDGSVGWVRLIFVSFTAPPATAVVQTQTTQTAQQCPTGQSWLKTTYGGYCYPNFQPATGTTTAEATYSVQQLQLAKQAADQAAKEYNDLLVEHNNLLAEYNSQSLPQAYSAPSGGIGRRMLYGMGQAMAAQSGLPTDYQIQQAQYEQALQARQLAYEQLQLQYQSVQLAKQAADQAAKEYNALVNQARQ